MYESSGIELVATLIYLALIFVSVIMAVFGSILLLTLFTHRKIDVKEEIVYNRNIGIALVLGSFIWTIGQMCLRSTKPIMNVFFSTYATGFTFGSAVSFTVGILGSMLTAVIFGGISVFLALKILMGITKGINEWQEIKQENIAVAVVISITVIVVGMFFESIVSYIVTNIISFA
jgi:hypothetical protein